MSHSSHTNDREDIAVNIAVLIDRDPIMAARIKEHISEKRLLECLALNSPAEDLAQMSMTVDPAPVVTAKSQANREPVTGQGWFRRLTNGVTGLVTFGAIADVTFHISELV